MNISKRLRKLADSTGLDAFGDEIRAIADEMDACGSSGTQSDPQAGLTFTCATQPAEVTDADIVAVMRDGNNCNYNDEAEHIQFARAILALRPEQVPMTEWQPIETAPLAGPFLAVLDCGGEQTICTMRHGVVASKNSRPDGEFIRERVTHWMPLPPLPKSTYTGITAQAKKEDE